MSQGRLQCRQCGANNFDTVTACWKCSAPLGGAGSPNAGNPRSQPVHPAPQPSQSPFAESAYRAAAPMLSAGNPGLSNKAALWLGILMPYFGLPIGLAFMMCDDRRRQEVGKICLLWSCISLLVHFLVSLVATIALREYFQIAVSGLRGAISRPGGLGGMGSGID